LGGAITENSVLLFKEYKKINMDIPNGNWNYGFLSLRSCMVQF
jgi:hypothetical protein